jgi:hypothetical protein
MMSNKFTVVILFFARQQHNVAINGVQVIDSKAVKTKKKLHNIYSSLTCLKPVFFGSQIISLYPLTGTMLAVIIL